MNNNYISSTANSQVNNNKHPTNTNKQASTLIFHPNNSTSTNPSPYHQHNFIVNKKNVDGNLLLHNFNNSHINMKNYTNKHNFYNLNNTMSNGTKYENYKKRFLFERSNFTDRIASFKDKSQNRTFIVPKDYKRRSGSSQSYREEKNNSENQSLNNNRKHVKTSQDTFLFKKSMQLKDSHFIIQNPEHLLKMIQQKRNSLNRSNLIHLSLECPKQNKPIHKQVIKQMSTQSPALSIGIGQQSAQKRSESKVQKCNLLSKYLFQTSEIKNKQSSIIKRNTNLRTKKYSTTKKIEWKKNLKEFLPKIQFDFTFLQQSKSKIDNFMINSPQKGYHSRSFVQQSLSFNQQQCSAKSFSILLNNCLIFAKNGQFQRQIASLTKIMTCITVLYLVQKFQLNIQLSQIKISRQSSTMTGTSSGLKFGDILTIKDLLYGMMLPSGNDSAYTLSEYFGRLLYKRSPEYQQKLQEMIRNQQLNPHVNTKIVFSASSNSSNNTNFYSAWNSRNNNHTQSSSNRNPTTISNDNKNNDKISHQKTLSISSSQKYPHHNNINNSLTNSHLKNLSYISSQHAVNYFINQMNHLARHLQMRRTHFSSPHGLSDFRNKSTSNDVAKLAYHCMKSNQRFRQIVSTKCYQAKIFNKNTKMRRVEKWINSNLSLFDQVLGEKCYGIKTGITPNAGPCLASYLVDGDRQITVVLLNCQSKQDRFREVELIYNKIIDSNIKIVKNNPLICYDSGLNQKQIQLPTQDSNIFNNDKNFYGIQQNNESNMDRILTMQNNFSRQLQLQQWQEQQEQRGYEGQYVINLKSENIMRLNDLHSQYYIKSKGLLQRETLKLRYDSGDVNEKVDDRNIDNDKDIEIIG